MGTASPLAGDFVQQRDGLKTMHLQQDLQASLEINNRAKRKQ
jgi:hypothetical protein